MSFVKNAEQVELLARSKEVVGYLQNRIVDPDNGQTLLGRHREFADKNWPKTNADKEHVRKFIAKNFPTIQGKLMEDLARELIITHGNYQRSPCAEETKVRFVRIAKVFQAAGFENQRICAVMSKVLPYSDRQVERILPKEFKMGTVPQSRHVSTSQPASALSAKLDETAKEVRTALDVGNTLTGDTYAFLDCKCRQCDHKEQCGHPPDTS